MNYDIAEYAKLAGFRTDNLSAPNAAHQTAKVEALYKMVVKDCLEVVNSAHVLCGSGVPDHVLVDMIMKNIRGYFGIEK